MKQFPSFAVAYGELGDLLTELSRFDEALDVLDRAVRVDPGYAQGFLLRAVAFSGKGMWKEAEEAFDAFNDQFPPTGNSEFQRGTFYQAAGEPEKALKCLRSALARDPSQYRAHLVMSMCYNDLGMEEEAAAAKARWVEADEMVKRSSHQKRLDAKARFGPATGPGAGGEEPGPPGGDGEEPPVPGDGSHEEGGG
jgi:Tfp pilus assembly protein PilF